ncbi:MAG: ferrous iron transport protein A [Dehalococcoidia bacterium]|nr:ferrous iron transport protein A [Dehalococcoidia bacterium]
MSQLKDQLVPLAMVSPGEKARIVSLSEEKDVERRLRDMGLSLGSEIEVLVAGNRSPLLLAAGETRLAIEPDLARQVRVRRFGGPRGGRGWGRRHHGRGRRWRTR